MRNIKSAKETMIEAIKKDLDGRFAKFVREGVMHISVAHTCNLDAAKEFANEIKATFKDVVFDYVDELSLSVATHTGPKVLAVGCYRMYK